MSKIVIQEFEVKVEDINDFNDEAGEILTAFCEDLQSKGMTRPVDEESIFTKEEGIHFWWDQEAINLIKGEIKRLESIGVKYFGLTLNIDISSHMFKEP